MEKGKLTKFLFTLPAIILVLIFGFVPLIYSFIFSFRRYILTNISANEFVGVENYINTFKDEIFIQSLVRTILLVTILLVSEFFIGLVVALLLSRGFKMQGFARTILLLPIATTPVIVGLTFKLMLDPFVGVVNYLLSIIGIKGPVWLGYPGSAIAAVVMMDIWQWVPFIAIILLTGILSQPKEIIEASVVDGASWIGTTTKITIPLLGPVATVVLLIRSTDAFRLFDQIWMLTKGGPGTNTETLTINIYKQAFQSFNIGRANAMAMIMMIISIGFIFFIIRRVKLLES